MITRDNREAGIEFSNIGGLVTHNDKTVNKQQQQERTDLLNTIVGFRLLARFRIILLKR